MSPEEAPQLHQLVEELATYARLPKPRVAIIDSPSPNAFATGRDANHAVVAVTYGHRHLLCRDELAGVLAHELGHVRNHDILISSVAATVAGAITMLAHVAQWAMIFGGLGATRRRRRVTRCRAGDDHLRPAGGDLIQLAISRSREYHADDDGGAHSWQP